MEDLPPKKKRVSKPKNPSKPKKTIPELEFLPPKKVIDVPEILKMLAKHIADPFEGYLIQDKKAVLSSMAAILGEYMDSWIVVGTLPNGEVVARKHVTNARDELALSGALSAIVTGIVKFE